MIKKNTEGSIKLKKEKGYSLTVDIGGICRIKKTQLISLREFFHLCVLYMSGGVIVFLSCLYNLPLHVK